MRATLPSESRKGRGQCTAGRHCWRTAVVLMVLGVAAFSANTANAQRVQDWLRLAEDALEENDPYGALRYMEIVMETDSNRARHNYLYAEALRHNNRYAKSAYYYNKIYRRDQDRFFPEGGFWLATMHKQAGNYPESKKIWRRVRDSNAHEPEGYKHQKAIQEMRSCDLAEVWSSGPDGFELEPVPRGTNTEASEFAGAVTPSGALVYSALRGETDDKGRVTNPESYSVRLYISKSPKWDASEPFAPMPGTEGDANFAVSSDSTYTAFTAIEGGRPAIYLAGGSRGSAFVKVLPADVSDSAYYSHPAFGEVDGRAVLFFTSDREGGEGMLDIWYLDLETPGKPPVNPGPPLNTPGNEVTPFFRKDKAQLYFASDWHHGFGGYDIFSTERNGEKYAVPQNMKKPWNTTGNDLYYNFNRAAGAGTITSDRAGAVQRENEGCCNDLWRFEEADFEYEDTLYISSLEVLNDYLPVTLYFHNDEPDPRNRRDTTALTYFETYYNYLDLLPEYQSQYRAGLDPEAGVEAEEAMDMFFLEKVDKGVNDLSFFAPLLLKELEAGEEIQLTVRGFASPLAETDYNVKLTSRRIVSLENYLRNFEGGAFLPYMEGRAEGGGMLEIVRVPFGEYTAETLVSDNPNESDAVWSIGAALERKIEISSVQRAPADSTTAAVTFASEIADLGAVRAGTEVPFSFVFEVGAGADFTIDSIACDRDVIRLDDIEPVYAAGSPGVISGLWIGGDRGGKIRESIVLFGNTAGGERELNVVLEVK